MNEVAQVLRQTNHERKVAGYGAHHKKNGSAVAKLGNKPMSWQEIQSKHGEEETFPSTDCLISYSDFIRYTPDLKVEYVNKMMDKYDIDLQHISRYLFNKGDDGLRSYLRNNKLLNLCNYKAARAKSGLLQFQADIEEWKRREKMSREIDEAEAQRKRDIIWNAEFIDYKEFKTLPIDGQVAYINNLIKKYSISLAPIATCLFKVDQRSLRDHFKRYKVYDQIEKSKSGNGKTGKMRIATFADAVNNWRGESTLEEKSAKEEAAEIASNLLATIIGKSEPVKEEPKKVELPESNISAVYIPVEQETAEVPVTEPLETVADVDTFVEQSVISAEEMLDKRIEDLNKKLTPDPIVSVDDVFKQVGLPKINLEFTAPTVKETPKPSSEVYFSTRYISEKGLDREQIMNKIYLLASLFENEENLEITLTVATKKEA